MAVNNSNKVFFLAYFTVNRIKIFEGTAKVVRYLAGNYFGDIRQPLYSSNNIVLLVFALLSTKVGVGNKVFRPIIKLSLNNEIDSAVLYTWKYTYIRDLSPRRTTYS